MNCSYFSDLLYNLTVVRVKLLFHAFTPVRGCQTVIADSTS